MSGTVNFRSKRTESEDTTISALYKSRVEKVTIRKKYEDEIEKDNEKLKKEITSLLEPIASHFQTPIEFIIETNRCILQKKLFCSPKAKQSSFVTTLSVDIPPIGYFLKDHKNIKQLQSCFEKGIRRINILTKKNIGKVLHPLIVSPSATVTNLGRKPGSPMIIVTYNLRTRYDF